MRWQLGQTDFHGKYVPECRLPYLLKGKETGSPEWIQSFFQIAMIFYPRTGLYNGCGAGDGPDGSPAVREIPHISV